MRLARFRRLAWVLALVLATGLAAPAFASMLGAGGAGAFAPGAHVHGDGTVHAHAKPPAHDETHLADPGAKPVKAPLHCPGCLSAAECALSCLGAAVLPASVPSPADPVSRSWIAGPNPSLLAFVPASDLDPPRPVPVR